MLKTEILDELFGARDIIADQIIALTPRDEAERAKLGELMKLRDRLSAKINEAIAAPFLKDTSELEAAAKRLENTTRELKALKQTMEGIQLTLDIADQVIKLAASIIALAL